MRLCSIEGCGLPHNSRGYCRRHYNRFLRYGDPLGTPEPRPPWQHGTFTGYNNHGCRCEPCRAAGSVGQKKYRENNRGVCARCGGPTRCKWDKTIHCHACAMALREAPHGTESRYKRCRCEKCRAASATARRNRRRAARVAA